MFMQKEASQETGLNPCYDYRLTTLNHTVQRATFLCLDKESKLRFGHISECEPGLILCIQNVVTFNRGIYLRFFGSRAADNGGWSLT